MAKKLKEFPPFPPLNWDVSQWEASTKLPAFSPKRKTRLVVRTASRKQPKNADDAPPPSAAQTSAYRHLTEHADSLYPAVLAAIREIGDESLQQVIDDGGENVSHEEACILATELEGAAYVAFVFAFLYEEHLIGVLTHRDRIVTVAMAEEVLSEKLAARDAKKQTKG